MPTLASGSGVMCTSLRSQVAEVNHARMSYCRVRLVAHLSSPFLEVLLYALPDSFHPSPDNSTMTSKLVPQDPSRVMVIRNVTPNIWTCSQPFNRFGRFKVGGRGTIGSYTYADSATSRSKLADRDLQSDSKTDRLQSFLQPP